MTEPVPESATPVSQQDPGRPSRPPRRGGRTHVRPVIDDIQDDARRSVSVRINTSDYGRLKAIAGRLGVRESDVFRHLVRTGIGRLMRVLFGNEPRSGRYRLLVSLVAELGEDFALSAAECAALLESSSAAPLALDEDDIQLIAMSASHPQQACSLLASRLNEPIESAALTLRLGRYLEEKHGGSPA